LSAKIGGPIKKKKAKGVGALGQRMESGGVGVLSRQGGGRVLIKGVNESGREKILWTKKGGRSEVVMGSTKAATTPAFLL